MTRLGDIQTDLQDFVTKGGTKALDHVIDDDRASAAQRLDVYYQAYRLRLAEVLATDFGGLQALAGESAFPKLVDDYLQTYPSTHPSVRWVGRHLAGYLAEFRPDRPELAEMAGFEWSWGLAFDAADSAVVGLESLKKVAGDVWPSLCFRFHPSVQQLDLCANVPEIFLAVTADRELPPLRIAAATTPWLLWRQDLRVKWRSLEADEAWALEASRAGRDFAGLCSGLCEWHDEAAVPLRSASLLKQWLTDGLITAIVAES